MSTAYSILEQIYVGARTVVYRAVRTADDVPVVVKTPREEYPSRSTLARYRAEFQVARSIAPGIAPAVLDLVEDEGRPMLIFEDNNAATLAATVSGRALNLHEFLPLAIRLADALAKIHVGGVMHKDINPRNIIVTTGWRDVRIIDFGSASLLALESPGILTAGTLEGTLAYMSPEQTGRMNRLLDHRTDLYSLGVTFYELLTGSLPFPTGDMIETVHAHIALVPQPPAERDSAVPTIVSDIVMMLLEKTAEARYQSAAGLRADLEECFRHLRERVAIDPFPLGTHDRSGALRIPQKLYGREEERGMLLGSFERTSAGLAEVAFIDGVSGIGKSALVHEVHRPIVAQRGYFVEGKFDLLQRNVAYSGLLKALRELVRQLLTERADVLDALKDRLTSALGANGLLMTELVPELEMIIGPQPPVAELGAADAQRRFDRTFAGFVRTFASPEHPLVIFLDDLQWADEATLKFLSGLMTDSLTRYLLLIGAYRGNEITSGHPLLAVFDALTAASVPVQTISLGPLPTASIAELLADALGCDTAHAEALAVLAGRKTAGNPFFLNQFLLSLAEMELLRFDSVRGQWTWDLSAVANAAITENVVELMAGKIRRLPPTAQQALQIAACIGGTFDIQTLAVVTNRTEEDAASDLLPAATEQLIIGADRGAGSYRFLHDRVQEAAHALLEEAPRAALHHTIGSLLLQRTPPDQRAERVFDIVTHLNYGLDLIRTDEERRAVAQLNHQAGERAKASGAYDAAAHYFDVALRLLPASPWTADYEFTRVLTVGALNAAFLRRDDDAMERFDKELVTHAATAFDKIPAYEIRIQYGLANNTLGAVVNNVVDILNQLGVRFPGTQTKLAQIVNLFRCRLLVGSKRPEYFEKLPLMTDPRLLIINRLLSSATLAIYLGKPSLLPVTILQLLRFAKQGGLSPYATHAFNGYAFFLTVFLNDIPTGHAFGQLALSTMDRFHADEMKSGLYLGYYGLIDHWMKPMRESVPPLKEAFVNGVNTGDLKNAANAVNAHCYHLMFSGADLEVVEQACTEFGDRLAELRQDRMLAGVRQYRQVVRNLMGKSPSPTKLVGEDYDEVSHVVDLDVAHDVASQTSYNTLKGMIMYYFGEPEVALSHFAVAGKTMMTSLPGTTFVGVHNMFQSLSLLAVPGPMSRASQQLVAKNQKKIRAWAKHAPQNFAHKFSLVEGERRRVDGKIGEALEMFDAAIEGARTNGFVQDEALAGELAARMCAATGRTHLAKFYARESHFAYARWGAAGKTAALEAWMPELASSARNDLRGTIHSPATLHTSSLLGESVAQQHTYTPETLTTGMEALDTATVLKASHALSREIVLSRLLERLVAIACENAGAEQGALLLQRDGRWFVEARRNADGSTLTEPTLLAGGNLAPEAVVHYVARTKETVVLDNASQEGRFVRDPYIASRGTKSLLCAPLLTQGTLVGLLILENNLLTNAFPVERVEVITLLSSQAAISIENARLYENLQRKTEGLARTNTAYSRFVPREFLSFLNRDDITEVMLGDQVQREMTVLFSDIWAFTTLSERMTPKENFDFLNSLLRIIGPVIRVHRGFIDKYIGDAVMALFPASPANAVDAAIGMRRALEDYNTRQSQPVNIGVGIHTGSLMLGTIGEEERMEGTVISDAVNLASRIEGLTRRYGAGILVSEETLRGVSDPERYAWRRVDRVRVHGKQDFVTIIEILDGDDSARRECKLATCKQFEQGLDLYYRRAFTESIKTFEDIMRQDPHDRLVQLYLQRANAASITDVSADWDGVETLTTK